MALVTANTTNINSVNSSHSVCKYILVYILQCCDLLIFSKLILFTADLAL